MSHAILKAKARKTKKVDTLNQIGGSADFRVETMNTLL